MKKWYHITEFEGSEIVYETHEEMIYKKMCNFLGPFDTFNECKKDAIEYHRSTIVTGQNAIYDIKQFRAKDIKNPLVS